MRPLIGWMVCVAISNVGAQDAQDCHVGSYRLSTGALVDVAPSEGDTLRWRQLDGQTGALYKTATGAWRSTKGWTGHGDGKVVAFTACGEGQIQFDGVS